MNRTQFDRRTLLSVGAIGVAASTLGLRAGLAQEGEDQEATPQATPTGGIEASHPAHIHAGTCEELGDVVFPLNDVAPLDAEATPAASPAAGAGDVVAESITEVEASLDDILATEHAINVHESAENIQNYIACGDLTGPASDGELRIELKELNGSGYTGEAHLLDNGDGTTTVTVTLMTTSGAAGTPEAEASEQRDAAAAVGIDNFKFLPDTLEVAAGTKVTWTNMELSPHTVVADDGSFESDTLSDGDTFSFTFETAGTFPYFCGIHTSMKGEIVVS